MATFLKAHETRNLALSVTASVIAGIATILIAGTYMARKGSEQTIARTMAIQQQPRMQENVYSNDIYSMSNVDMKGTSSDRSKQKLTVSIATSEFYNNQFNLVLTHTFYGNNEEEIENLVQAHRITDSFFDASFKGIFKWKGTEIKLKNIVQYS